MENTRTVHTNVLLVACILKSVLDFGGGRAYCVSRYHKYLHYLDRRIIQVSRLPSYDRGSSSIQ